MSTSQGLHDIIVGLKANAQFPSLVEKIVHITIFNDLEPYLKYLMEIGNLSNLVKGLIGPITNLNQQQVSMILHGIGLRTTLTLRWMPGLKHMVYSHQRADKLSRRAMKRGKAWCSRTGILLGQSRCGASSEAA